MKHPQLAVGAGLQDVSEVTLVGQAAGDSIPLDVQDRSATRLTARAPVAVPMTGVAVTFTTDDGRSSLERPPGDSVTAVPAFATDHYIVRFMSGAVAVPARYGRSPLSSCDFASADLRSTLAAHGVEELEPLLPWASPDDTLVATMDAGALRLPDLSTIYIAHLGSETDVSAATLAASVCPGVLYAHKDYMATAASADPYYASQWGLHNTGGGICWNYFGTPFPYPSEPGYDIGAEDAWSFGPGFRRVPVAVLDSGIDTTHVDLQGVAHLDTMFTSITWGGQGGDLDDNGYHGTHVAGIIGAIRDNGVGVAGITSQADLFAVNVFQASDYGGAPTGFTSWMAAGISRAAARGIRLINLSGGTSAPQLDSINALMDVCDAAFQAGCLLVASAGNIRTLPAIGDNTDTLFSVPVWPARFGAQALAVGAVLPDGRRWRDGYMSTYCSQYSGLCAASNTSYYHFVGSPWYNYDWLDVVAPGGAFIVTTKQGPEGVETLEGCDCQNLLHRGFTGTSAAAPFVTGAAATLWARRPELTNEDVTRVLERTTWPQDGWSREKGWGMIRVGEALRAVAPPRIVVQRGIAAGLTGVDSLRVVGRLYGSYDLVDKYGASVSYPRWRYTLEGTVRLEAGFQSEPWVWTRARGSLGTAGGDGMNEMAVGYGGEVVRTTADSVTFRTHVYYTPATQSWYPADTLHARLAYTAIGDGPLTDVEGDESSGLGLRVFPNPSWGRTQVSLSLPWRAAVRVSVYDVAGRRVVDLAQGVYDVGVWSFAWNGETEAGEQARAGVYFCGVDVNGRRLVRRVAVLRMAR
jgi:subtilisin family serine protease